jgi:hypothetical protein
MKNYEQFHDGYFEGMWVPGQGTTHVYLATSGRDRSIAVLNGVVMLKVTGFKEGNIILDVGTCDSPEATLEDIATLYDLKPGHEPANWEVQLLDRIRNGSLVLFSISTSYGGECLILAEKVSLLSEEAWKEHYMLVRSSK